MADDLGFGDTAKNRPKLDLTGLDAPKPVERAKGEGRSVDHAADRAAERAGFTSREPSERVFRERRAKEPTDQLFVRGPLSVINRYKTHCNETGMSYGELLEDLMKRAGI